MSGDKKTRLIGGNEQSDGPEVPKFAARNRVAERKRQDLMGVVMQSSKECYKLLTTFLSPRNVLCIKSSMNW